MLSSFSAIKLSKQLLLCLLVQSKSFRSKHKSVTLFANSFSVGGLTSRNGTRRVDLLLASKGSRPTLINRNYQEQPVNNMMKHQGTKNDDDMEHDIPVPTRTITTKNNRLSTSNEIQNTLDPCVVLMKQLISKYSHLWDDNDKGGIYSLAQGVVYWEPPKSAYEELSKALKLNASGNSDNNHASEISNDLHQYCPDEGLSSLIQAIKVKLERENHIPNTDATQIIITAGANQAYMNCVLSILSEGKYNDDDSDDSEIKDACVVFKPYYFNHVMAVQMTRGNDALVVGPIDEDGIPCIEWLRQTLSSKSLHEDKLKTRIKMVTITNPGNPTGVSIPHEKLQQIVDLCKEYGVWVVMDNTYEHFDHERVNSFDIPSTKDDEASHGFHCFQDEHVISIFSFSKGYAMAGFRVGYVVINANGEEGSDLYKQMVKVNVIIIELQPFIVMDISL